MKKNTSQPKTRKIPERHCLGCNQPFPKKDLLRVVRAPDGTVSLDFVGKKPGRGAYLCKSLACFRKARKARRIGSALEVEIPEDILQALEQEITLFEEENRHAE